MTLPLLDPSARPVVAHRGAAAHAPENTLASFEAAIDAGADALEFDVHLSADGHVVVIHDPTLARTTDRSGTVAEMPLARIQAADAGARFTRDGRTFPFRGRGVRVPTLDEVLARFPSTPLLIEVKTTAATDALRRTLGRHGAAHHCVVGAFDHRALEPFRAEPWRSSASHADMLRMLSHVLIRRSLGAPSYRAIAIPPRWRGLPLPIGGIARAAGRHGIPVHVWVVDDPNAARRLWRLGVAGIITNDPAAILDARGAGVSA